MKETIDSAKSSRNTKLTKMKSEPNFKLINKNKEEGSPRQSMLYEDAKRRQE